MLVTSIFYFSHNVVKQPLSRNHQKSGLCGKELIVKGFLSGLQKMTFLPWSDSPGSRLFAVNRFFLKKMYLKCSFYLTSQPIRNKPQTQSFRFLFFESQFENRLICVKKKKKKKVSSQIVFHYEERQKLGLRANYDIINTNFKIFSSLLLR